MSTLGWRLAANYLSFALSATSIGLWKLRGQRFDVIFAYEPSPITIGLPAAALRSTKKAPLAFWVLDLWPETLQAIGVVRSDRLLRTIGKLVAFVYRRCDLILAQSRSFVPQIARYCTDPSRIEYFPSWAEAVFAAGETEPAAEVPIRAGSFDVMFAGNIGDAQDFPAVLNAAELLKSRPDIRWLLVGDGRMAGWVRGEIVRRGLQDTVLMLGRHPVEKMPAFYRHADALLVSLKNEPIFSLTIPGKLQSYLAAGIPIVAMLDGEGAEVVERGRAGVTCPAGDASGLASAVVRLVALPHEQRAQMGRNAAALSANEFDRGKLITRLELLLERLISGSGTRLPEADR